MKTIALLLICTATFAQQKGSFTDSRDGKTYKTVKIGSQTWFAENLNYDASGSVCYENNSANCEKYGRLYKWETALKACPKGWHLPSKGEWELLYSDVGGVEVANKKLKTESGWNNDGNGTDEYGFSALPGGYGNPDGFFRNAGDDGSWWSSSEYENNSNHAYYPLMYYYTEYAYWYEINKSYLLCVRCVQDRDEQNGERREYEKSIR